MTAAAPDRSRLVVSLAERFADDLDQSRHDLFQLSNLHPDFVKDCLATLDAKRQRLQSPLLGEVFPHLVAQGMRLEAKDRRMLAAAWLAIYGYISLIDYELDQKGFLDVRASIAASALLGWGVATLGRYTVGTPFEGVFLDSVTRAFSGQYDDLRIRGGDADRERSDIDKNRHSVMVTAAYCAAAGETDDRLVRAIEALLGAFQTLDDLEDLHEDHQENNITAFVKIVRECAASAQALARGDMYRIVIRDPRTQQVLRRAATAFERALLLLDARRDQALVSFVSDIKGRTLELAQVLDDYQNDPSSVAEPDVMERIEHVIMAC